MSKTCHECEKNRFVLPYEYFANPLTVVEEGGDWIQGAIKNPGRCTPGSPNYDCPKGSPQWNLAQRFKHGDLHKAQQGGDQQSQIMQIIAMYAKLHNTQPQMIIQKLQQLDESQQQQALQSMVAELQQGGAGTEQQSAPTSYAANDETMEMGSMPQFAPGGVTNYSTRGAAGLGSGTPYVFPMMNTVASGDSDLAGGVKAATGVLGLLSGAAGSLLGFGKTAQWLGNKIKPGSNILQNTNNTLKNIVDFGVDASNYNNQSSPYRPLDRKYIREAQNTNTSPINRAAIETIDFTKMPVYNDNPKYNDTMVAEYGGDLPQAQFGFGDPGFYKKVDKNQMNTDPGFYINTEGENNTDPYFDITKQFGFNNKRFGQTANYADTRDYESQPVILGKAPVADEEFFIPDATALSPQLSKRQQRKQDKADLAYDMQQDRAITEDTTDYGTNPIQNKNKNVNSNFNGMEYAQKAMAGLGAFNSYLDWKENKRRKREYKDMLKRVGNTDFRLASNSPNPFGNYTMNVGPGNNFQLGMTTPIQDFGTVGKYGGSFRYGGSYEEGGEYQVSEEELLQLMQNGAEIEFINK
jgi:hypothetical protein